MTGNVTDSDLMDLFSKFGKVLLLSHLPHIGCAFIKMDNRANAVKALSNLKGMLLKDNLISVS